MAADVVGNGLAGGSAAFDPVGHGVRVGAQARVAQAVGLDQLKRQPSAAVAGHAGRDDEQVATTEHAAQGHVLDGIEVQVARQVAVGRFSPGAPAALGVLLPGLGVLFAQPQKLGVDLRSAGQAGADDVGTVAVDDAGCHGRIALKVCAAVAQRGQVGNDVRFR
jgi:hypothetical protein